jgi:MFS superfamily sulfate permease-like transporter
MTVSFPISFAIAVAILIAVAFFAKRMAKHSTIHIPRTPGPARSNAMGTMIIGSVCPVCRQENFYSGDEQGILFCGNPKCRTGFLVTNYGESNVWAEEIRDKGPDRLYH